VFVSAFNICVISKCHLVWAFAVKESWALWNSIYKCVCYYNDCHSTVQFLVMAAEQCGRGRIVGVDILGAVG
jgi:hypothetical protein